MEIIQEYAGARLGDRRRSARLVQMASRMAHKPEASFCSGMTSEAELEAAYRFFGTASFEGQAILAPHCAQTRSRMQSVGGDIVVAHDTTQFLFPTVREGLGRGMNPQASGRALYGHMALAVGLEAQRPALGVLGVETYIRPGDKPKHRSNRAIEKTPEKHRESGRWWRMVEQVETQLSKTGQVLHVMDREADAYLLLARMCRAGARFVVRSHHNRGVLCSEDRHATLRSELRGLRCKLTRTVKVHRKAKALSGKALVKHGLREATLEISATTVTVKAPEHSHPSSRFRIPDALSLGVVHVREAEPPQGYEPVDWKLLTTEPIQTTQDIERVIDAYRARWRIEEFFKALKTGCAFEKRQLQSRKAIDKALCFFIPLAWKMLHLRHLADFNPDGPASTAVSELQVKLLQNHPDTRLKKKPTALDVLLAIAKLGGHLKRNGPPGWITLGRGFQSLLELEQGARIALNLPSSLSFSDL